MNSATVLELAPSSLESPRCFLDSDFGEISSWWVKRNKNPPAREILPMHGRIVPGIACGFLFRTDSALGLLEFFSTNPDAGLKTRKKAMDRIVSSLIEDAKRAGIKIVYGGTEHSSILKFVKKIGFHVETEPYYGLAKVI